MLTFDWTINITNLLGVCAWVGSLIYTFANFKAELRIVKHDVSNISLRQDVLNDSVKIMADVITKVAVQEERFNHLDHRLTASEDDIRDLQNGIGFKTERVSGEYTRHGKVTR